MILLSGIAGFLFIIIAILGKFKGDDIPFLLGTIVGLLFFIMAFLFKKL